MIQTAMSAWDALWRLVSAMSPSVLHNFIVTEASRDNPSCLSKKWTILSTVLRDWLWSLNKPCHWSYQKEWHRFLFRWAGKHEWLSLGRRALKGSELPQNVALLSIHVIAAISFITILDFGHLRVGHERWKKSGTRPRRDKAWETPA